MIETNHDFNYILPLHIDLTKTVGQLWLLKASHLDNQRWT